jgi:sporulation protein YlmC with PRC-barrel domain
LDEPAPTPQNIDAEDAALEVENIFNLKVVSSNCDRIGKIYAIEMSTTR